MKKVYVSKYGREKSTAAQYITEILCERKAAAEKKQLPLYFWKIKEWWGYYIFQLKLCNKLLKEYSEDVMFYLIESNPRLFSLRHPDVESMLHNAKLAISQKGASSLNISECSVGNPYRKKTDLDRL